MIPHTTHFSGCDCVMDKIQKLEAENARLREALIFRGYDPDSELKHHESERQNETNT